jgi:hypothetical protein
MTGPRTVTPKLLAADGIGDLTFNEALSRCRYRSICLPRGKGGGPAMVEACIALLGPPAPLHAELLDRLQADVARGRTFMIATEYEATLKAALEVVDQMSLLAAVPVGRA